MTKLLVVDDDRELVELLAFGLGRAGFEVKGAHDSPTALRLIEEERPDAAILDVNMGPWNGLDLLKTIRKSRSSSMVVLMLTCHDDEASKVRGLELGADDYVTKPFSFHELVARVNAQLRRYGRVVPEMPKPIAPVLQIGPINIDSTTHAVVKDGSPVHLTATEFRVLHYLMANAGTVVRTRQIMKQIWGFDDPSGRDTVRVTLHRLRSKVEDNPSQPHFLHTVPGVGVMFCADPVPA